MRGLERRLEGLLCFSLLHQPKARERTDGGRERARRPERRFDGASACFAQQNNFRSVCCGPTMSTTTASAAPRPAQPSCAEKCAALCVGWKFCCAFSAASGSGARVDGLGEGASAPSHQTPWQRLCWLCPTGISTSDLFDFVNSTTTASAAPRPAEPTCAEKCAALSVGWKLCCATCAVIGV
jgi:hypothetical protein